MTPDEREQRHDNGEERIDVRQRVPCKPAERVCRRVSLFQCSISVRVLVGHHGKQKYGRNEDEVLKLIQSVGVVVKRRVQVSISLNRVAPAH